MAHRRSVSLQTLLAGSSIHSTGGSAAALPNLWATLNTTRGEGGGIAGALTLKEPDCADVNCAKQAAKGLKINFHLFFHSHHRVPASHSHPCFCSYCPFISGHRCSPSFSAAVRKRKKTDCTIFYILFLIFLPTSTIVSIEISLTPSPNEVFARLFLLLLVLGMFRLRGRPSTKFENSFSTPVGQLHCSSAALFTTMGFLPSPPSFL